MPTETTSGQQPAEDFDSAFDEAIGLAPASEEGGEGSEAGTDEGGEGGEGTGEAGTGEGTGEAGTGEGTGEAGTGTGEGTGGEGGGGTGEDAAGSQSSSAGQQSTEAGRRTVADYTPEELAEVINGRQPGQQSRQGGEEKEPPKELTLDDYLSDEEKETLKQYEQDWGEVSKAESIRRKAELGLQRDQLKREMAAALAPIVQHVQQSQVSSHFSAIEQAHPGYQDMLPSVQSWVAEQPEFLKKQMNAVLEKGNSSQVIEVFNLYKQQRKTGAAPASPASSETPSSSESERSSASSDTSKEQQRKAASATAAVKSSRRSTKVTSKDDDDFDGAFEEAAGQL